jgi:hypothetical protein
VPAGLIIVMNVWQSIAIHAEIQKNPWFALTAPQAYSFLPPWTAFEVGVMACAALGGFFLYAVFSGE